MTTVSELDTMPRERAGELLRACCGAAAWVQGMLARRPYGDLPSLLAAADEVWSALGAAEWREAFTHHPRIGEAKSATTQNERARVWSSGEQSGMRDATAGVRAALAAANAAYDARFGYICIICATGKSAQELLSITSARLRNEPDVELRVAAEEQRKITRLRLKQLVTTPSGAPAT
jgi:2-oxo-4-hydroxy-4-carboxy-5-ureidoimidazoline decarboxylase